MILETRHFPLFIATFFTLFLSGCFIGSVHPLHGNMEHFKPTDFFGTGNYSFDYAEENEKSGSFHITVYNDYFSAFQTDYGNYMGKDPTAIVRSDDLPEGYYLAVSKEEDEYRYFLFQYHDETSFTFFHECTTGQTESDLTQAGLIAKVKSCIAADDGTKYNRNSL